MHLNPFLDSFPLFTSRFRLCGHYATGEKIMFESFVRYVAAGILNVVKQYRGKYDVNSIYKGVRDNISVDMAFELI